MTSRGVKMKNGIEVPKLRGETAYTNGGAICKKCRAFASMFNPIVKLGDWKKGPSIHDLTMAAEGYLRPTEGSSRTKESRKYARQSELRLRAAGVKLPETPSTPSNLDLFDEPDDYMKACKSAVVSWYEEHREDFKPGSPSSMAGLFSALDHRTMERMMLEELEERGNR